MFPGAHYFRLAQGRGLYPRPEAMDIVVLDGDDQKEWARFPGEEPQSIVRLRDGRFIVSTLRGSVDARLLLVSAQGTIEKVILEKRLANKWILDGFELAAAPSGEIFAAISMAYDAIIALSPEGVLSEPLCAAAVPAPHDPYRYCLRFGWFYLRRGFSSGCTQQIQSQRRTHLQHGNAFPEESFCKGRSGSPSMDTRLSALPIPWAAFIL